MRALGQCLRTKATIDAGQIHADDQDFVFSLQPVKIAFQRSFTASQNDIEHGVPLEIAEGGGITQTPGKEVLINAQDAWTDGTASLSDVAFEKVLGPALYRCTGHDTGPM